jgi:hypothetical protein
MEPWRRVQRRATYTHCEALHNSRPKDIWSRGSSPAPAPQPPDTLTYTYQHEVAARRQVHRRQLPPSAALAALLPAL